MVNVKHFSSTVVHIKVIKIIKHIICNLILQSLLYLCLLCCLNKNLISLIIFNGDLIYIQVTFNVHLSMLAESLLNNNLIIIIFVPPYTIKRYIYDDASKAKQKSKVQV